MDKAGVDRCVIVPMMPPTRDELSRSNQAALTMAQDHADRFGVMGLFDLTKPENAGLLTTWGSTPGMLGFRVAFLRDPNLSLLAEDRLEWFWSAAEEAGIPIMLLAPDMAANIDRIASGHPQLRLIVDHLNLDPRIGYEDLLPAIEPLLGLAKHGNVAVKASALPCWARDRFPFPSLHRPIARVVEAFGPRRVFWGSDLTRLPCSYADCVRLFTQELPFLSEHDKDWITGRGVIEWLKWDFGGQGSAG
jgi:predicted TIM-barrel fold metal-dependent hydrolase